MADCQCTKQRLKNVILKWHLFWKHEDFPRKVFKYFLCLFSAEMLPFQVVSCNRLVWSYDMKVKHFRLCFYSGHINVPHSLISGKLIVHASIFIYYTDGKLALVQIFICQAKTIWFIVRFEFCNSYNFYSTFFMFQFSSTWATNNG